MAVQEWSYREDKKEWPVGPWTSEADKVQWVDEATGLDCLILRNRSGALCGYVGVPESHPWHGKGYSSCTRTPVCEEGYCDHGPDSMVRVHGGLTFADACHESGKPEESICHIPEPGRPEHVWWFGFDCHHSGDLGPSMIRWNQEHGFSKLDRGDVYRDRAYVEAEVAALAKQIAAAQAA